LRWSRIPFASTLTFMLFAFTVGLVLLLPHYALAFTQTLGKSDFSGAEKIVFSALEVAVVHSQTLILAACFRQPRPERSCI
jgi:hypothetical protein